MESSEGEIEKEMSIVPNSFGTEKEIQKERERKRREIRYGGKERGKEGELIPLTRGVNDIRPVSLRKRN